eukprot:gene4267-5339_t
MNINLFEEQEDIISKPCNSSDLNMNNWESVKVSGRVPTPRHAHGMVLHNDSMYVFGGYGPAGTHLGDLYRFSCQTNHWDKIKVKASTTQIKPRHSHSMVSWGGYIWIFGGIGIGTDKNVYNDLYQYNPEKDEFTFITPTSNSFWPPPRWGHTSVVYKDKMLVFGGLNDISFFSNIVSYDFLTGQWSQFDRTTTGLGTVPRGRQYHSCSVINDRMYIFGGYDGRECKTDMFEYNLETNTWRGINPTTSVDNNNISKHVVRRGASTLTYGNCIYIFGGKNKNLSDSLYEFNTETLCWREIQLGSRPSKRQFSTGVIYEDSIYIFGGQSDFNENDIFKFSLQSLKNNDVDDDNNPRNNRIIIDKQFNTCFEGLIDNEQCSDIKFKVEGKIIHAHKCILITRNEHFLRPLLINGMNESRKDVIEINDISYNVFKAILTYLYTDEEKENIGNPPTSSSSNNNNNNNNNNDNNVVEQENKIKKRNKSKNQENDSPESNKSDKSSKNKNDKSTDNNNNNNNNDNNNPQQQQQQRESELSEDDDNDDNDDIFKQHNLAMEHEKKKKLLKEFYRKVLYSKILENKGSVARDHLANERTFLAWLRTALASIALGVALAKLGTSKAGGLIFVGLGTIILLYSPLRYFQVYRMLLKGNFSPNLAGTIIFVILSLASAIAALVIVLVNSTNNNNCPSCPACPSNSTTT